MPMISENARGQKEIAMLFGGNGPTKLLSCPYVPLAVENDDDFRHIFSLTFSFDSSRLSSMSKQQ